MFDDKTKNAWQAITPDPALREKVLAQAGGEPPVKKASVRPFLNLLRVTASIAACMASLILSISSCISFASLAKRSLACFMRFWASVSCSWGRLGLPWEGM